jgi:hypothetical protein
MIGEAISEQGQAPFYRGPVPMYAHLATGAREVFLLSK